MTSPLHCSFCAGSASRLPQPKSRPSYHVVQRGDTLSGLAVRYGTSVAELRRLNNMSKTSVLQAGRKLKLPGDASSAAGYTAARAALSYHVVQRGDTLSGLAVRYGTSMAELRRLNNMSKTSVLQAGRKLKLPGDAASAPAAPPLRAARPITWCSAVIRSPVWQCATARAWPSCAG